MAKRPTETAVDRLRRRIEDRIAADRHRPRGLRHTQSGLANHIGITKGTLSEMLSGRGARQGALARLDDIADYFGVPPSQLVHKNDTAQIEVTAQEYRVLLHWRRFPASVRERIMEMFDYFAGLLPEEQEARRLWHRFMLIRDPKVRAAIDRRIDEALHAQRSGPVANNPAAVPASSNETNVPTQTHQSGAKSDRVGRTELP